MQHLTLDSGTRIQYRDVGTGPPLVCVHGGFMSHEVWNPQFTCLPETFRMIAVDLRGHGGSDGPYGTCTLGRFAADVDALLDHLGVTDGTYLGWSLGATIGVRYLGQYGTDRIERAIFTSTGIFQGLADESRRRAADRTGDRDNFLDFDALRERHRSDNPTAMWEFVDGLFTDAVDDRTREWLYRIAMKTPRDVVLAVIDLYATMEYERLYDDAITIDCPVLAMQGRHDGTATIEEMEHTAEEVFPRGETMAFDASGHLPFVEEMDRFNDTVMSFAGVESEN